MRIMGQAMAKNILKAGYELMVYNRTPEKTATLGEASARIAVTQNEIADWTELIIIMVTGPEAIDDLLSGLQGLLVGEIRKQDGDKHEHHLALLLEKTI